MTKFGIGKHILQEDFSWPNTDWCYGSYLCCYVLREEGCFSNKKYGLRRKVFC